MKILPREAEYFHTNTKFNENPSSGSGVFPYGWRDGERHDELMSPFIISQRRLNCGKGIYENQKLSGIVQPLTDPVTRPRGFVHENRTGNWRHITSTPSLQWVNGQTASAATTGTPVRLLSGSSVQTCNGRTAIWWSRNGFERRNCDNCNKQHSMKYRLSWHTVRLTYQTSKELHR